MVVWLAGCAGAIPRTVPRVVDGRVEEGAAVSPYAYQWFIEGEIQAAQGHHERASLAFESAAAAPSSDVLLMTRLAEEYELSGASRRAERTLSAARRFDPGSPRIALAEGRILWHRGDLDAAALAFGRAIRLGPNWSEPVVQLADLLSAQGRKKRAEGLLLDYLRVAPAHRATAVRHRLIEIATRNGDPSMLMRALELDPATTEASRAERAARLALAHGKPLLAARFLEDAPRAPKTVKLWIRALIESGERARAVNFLLSRAAARWMSIEDRADALVELQQNERALELLSAAHRSPGVQYTRGTALMGAGDYVGAAALLGAIPYGASSFERSRLALADCATATGRRGAGAETLSTAPYPSLPVRKKLAEIYLGAGDARSALRLFDPRELSERAVLASVFERAGRYDEAAAYYAAVKVDANSAPRIRARASAERYASRGLRATAIAVLEQWTEVAPEDFFARVRLVELLQAEGRTKDATARGRELLGVIAESALRAHLVDVLRFGRAIP